MKTNIPKIKIPKIALPKGISKKKVLLFIYSAVFLLLVIFAVTLLYVLVCRFTTRYSVGDYGTEMTAETESETESETAYTGEGFLLDMRDYEKYINPIGEYSNAFLSLKANSEKYVPDDLVDINYKNVKGELKLREYAEKALEAMLLEMEAEGVNTVNGKTKLPLTVVAGYKSSDADDEHFLGLTVDIHNCQTSDLSFSNTDAYKWLSENCWRFGFVVRYPEDKYSVTGVTFRPWQFRYVGRSHARVMYENGLCLEEYVGK